MNRPLHTVGLFAGIGGIELGLERAGHDVVLLVENAPAAQAVLQHHFPEAKLEADVCHVRSLPKETELLTAGFPCQDLSSVGLKTGINGARSNLIQQVFALLERRRVPWVLLENVPFLLQLHRGRAMTMITRTLNQLGYAWAYRVLDSEAFGLPHRRRRLFLVASNTDDPRSVLLGGERQRPLAPHHDEVACGFYWTEGMRALGWAVDAVPPIKGGSSVGVPSPPAIMLTSGDVVTPDIRDAERLQGFKANWTKPAEQVARPGYRWQLVGNAVSVPVSEWLGRRFIRPVRYDDSDDAPLGDKKWPYAAWSFPGERVYASAASALPTWRKRPHLEDFLRFDTRPLSLKAARGFLGRTQKGNLRFAPGFLERVELHAQRAEDG